MLDAARVVGQARVMASLEQRKQKIVAELLRALAEDRPFPTRSVLFGAVSHAAAPLEDLLQGGRLREVDSGEQKRIVPGADLILAATPDLELRSQIETAVKFILPRREERVAASELADAIRVTQERATNLLLVVGVTYGYQSYGTSGDVPKQLFAIFGPRFGVISATISATVPRPTMAAQGHLDTTRPGSLDGASLPTPRELPVAPPPDFTLTVRNFRALRAVDWAPKGRCLLAGANGAGKTSTLRALAFLRAAYLRGLGDAVRSVGGTAGFRNVDAPGDDLPAFGFRWGDLTWEIIPSIEGAGLNPFSEERLSRGDEILLERSPLRPTWFLRDQEQQRPGANPHTCLRQAVDAGELPEAAPLVAALESVRTYGPYALEQVSTGTPTDSEASLHRTGRNLVSILAAWHAAPTSFRGNFQWVVEKARAALPGIFGGIEFPPSVGPSFYHPGNPDPDHLLPLRVAADGLLVTLLHLTAIAGAPDRAIIAIDEIENHLHPHAIRELIRAFDEQVAQRGLTIILTTHSPVVMNQFRARPEQLFVCQPGTSPRPLSELRDPDELAHFSLGGLYEDEAFGAPHAAP